MASAGTRGSGDSRVAAAFADFGADATMLQGLYKFWFETRAAAAAA